MRVCVYTAVYGNYDTLSQPVAQTVPCDFVCFTDSDWPRRVGAWQVVRSRARGEMHPRLRAKYFKVMSHAVFPAGRLAWRLAPFGWRKRYDFLIWVDGCLDIKSPRFAEEFVAHVRGNGWSMFMHPDRDCVYDELAAATGMAKCEGVPIDRQVASYRAEGYPEHRGLMANTLIARAADHPKLPEVHAAWWAENLKWSYLDQLSLPVVLWRLGHGYDPVRLDLWDNPWFERLRHNPTLDAPP